MLESAMILWTEQLPARSKKKKERRDGCFLSFSSFIFSMKAHYNYADVIGRKGNFERAN